MWLSSVLFPQAMHCIGNLSLGQSLLCSAIAGIWAVQSSCRSWLYHLPFHFLLESFSFPAWVMLERWQLGKKNLFLTRFLQIRKLNKNIMNNANFSLSQWANNAVQEGGNEQWGLLTAWLWLFPLHWPRKCPFPGKYWNGNAAGMGVVDWEEFKPDSVISLKLMFHRAIKK